MGTVKSATRVMHDSKMALERVCEDSHLLGSMVSKNAKHNCGSVQPSLVFHATRQRPGEDIAGVKLMARPPGSW